MNVKYVRPEKLSLAIGQRSAMKIRLIADFGILDEAFDRIVPPSFIWYEDRPPFDWLQYQGLETGLQSPDIIGSIVGSGADKKGR